MFISFFLSMKNFSQKELQINILFFKLFSIYRKVNKVNLIFNNKINNYKFSYIYKKSEIYIFFEYS